VILLGFKPNLAYKPRGDIAKMLQHATGHVWVSESDYELVKLEAQVIDTISFGMGILGRVQPGSRGAFEWRKINDEIWLPLREGLHGEGTDIIGQRHAHARSSRILGAQEVQRQYGSAVSGTRRKVR
jgi:hypothetical protein